MVEGNARLDLVFHALADPTRRRILADLAECGPQAVTAIARPFHMSLQAISKHLGVLARAGLVRRHRRGREQICALEGRSMADAAAWLETYREFWEGNLDQLAAFLGEEAGS